MISSIWILRLFVIMDEALLIEIGQSQLTEVTLGYDSDDIFDFEDDELKGFGFYEGECQGCYLFTMLNDFGLCEGWANRETDALSVCAPAIGRQSTGR
jgi:hypothetical protein